MSQTGRSKKLGDVSGAHLFGVRPEVLEAVVLLGDTLPIRTDVQGGSNDPPA